MLAPTTGIDRALLPMTAREGPDGWLEVGGVSIKDLKEEFGTPLFVYDEDHLRHRCREAAAAFGGDVSYASKAFLCRAMARLVHEEGVGLDVASGGEMAVATRAGVPPGRMVLHGNNKTQAELAEARRLGMGRIVVDSFDELERLTHLHLVDGVRSKVLVRVTPGVRAHTHAFISTGQDDSKFGFTLSDGTAERALELMGDNPAVEVVGIHMHIGSQVTSVDSFRRAIEVVADLVRRSGVTELSIGGGIGAAYSNGDEVPSISAWAAAAHETCDDLGLSVRLAAEPGRAIVAQAGITLYSVGTVKDLPGIRTYVAVDGGMSDNVRPALYGAKHEVIAGRAPFAARPRVVTIAGKHCESGDILVHDAAVPNDLAVDDVVVLLTTGAYTYAMASNYNKALRPGVVFVRDGRARLVVRPETYDDLMQLDVDDPPGVPAVSGAAPRR